MTLVVKFGTLNYSKTCRSGPLLDAKGKKLRIAAQDSGYRKTMRHPPIRQEFPP
jgi:hypothetical protein